MMVDAGTPGRPHRMNLLDLLNPYPCGGSLCVYNEVGIGYYDGATPNEDGLTSLITEDFGARSTTPYLLGVIYNDRNNNNLYDIGEGIGGVTITLSTGSYYAISSSSGSYAIPIPMSGTITVTASGPGFGPIIKSVTLNGINIKLDFTSQFSSQTSFQLTTQTSLQSITQTTSATTQTQSTTQTLLGPITFQLTPSSFPPGTTPGIIAACGSIFVNGQSSSGCGSNFTATANLPVPSTGWQFNHWMWSGSVTCSSYSANPTSCSASDSAGSLMAVYSAQITVLTNPASSALISWGSCSNPGQGNGSSFFSTSYGTSSVTACYIPYEYAFSNWNCSGGLACSELNNPTAVALTGPGTITLNLQVQPVNASSTTSSVTTLPSFTSNTSTVASSSTLEVTTTTYSTVEFGFDHTVMVGMLFVAALIIVRRKSSLSRAKLR